MGVDDLDRNPLADVDVPRATTQVLLCTTDGWQPTAATLVPARRASRVDPTAALRAD